MDKLTKQQLSGISELIHHIHNKEVIQCILETLGRDNWNRDILSNCVRYLNNEQDIIFESLGGGYSSEEIDEILYNDNVNFEISEKLKEMGVKELNIVGLDKAKRTKIVQLFLGKSESAKMVYLSVDFLTHFHCKFYTFIAALEDIDAVKVGMLVEHYLVHIEFVKVCVKQRHNTRG